MWNGPGLFVRYDPVTGAQSHVAVADIKVDNVGAGVGGGLPAHNYWDNIDGFVKPVAGIVVNAVNAGQIDLAGSASVTPADAPASNG